MAYPRNGPASRAVALDLMLRTFMNSADFHPSNPKIWENIAKLVPGTTPQQCAQRWEELRMSSLSVAGDFSGLTATGRPISGGGGRRQMSRYVRSMFSQQINAGASPSRAAAIYNNPSPSGNHGNIMRSPSGYHYASRQLNGNSNQGPAALNLERPGSSIAVESPSLSHSMDESSTGKFVANFFQTHLSGGNSSSGGGGGGGGGVSVGGARGGHRSSDRGENEEKSTATEGTRSGSSSRASEGDRSEPNSSSEAMGKNGPSMVIHVCDEAKKLKRDFVCPRDILVREMHYFEEYLSSDTQLWDEVDISVHCDVPVFEWLMKYTKRGMLEGPCGEKLSSPLEPPRLEPNSAVSILISSNFLKMDTLVEDCLNFCHGNISQIVASPCNMGCISERLLTRLAAKFTPLEVEAIADKKDKIKSKLFLYQLEKLFKANYSSDECPANAATLYRCKYCDRLLTVEQQSILPCAAKRLSVDRNGRVVFNHERADSWNINHHIQSLQKQEGLTPRNIYWRIWGLVNWLRCERCGCYFQCCELPLCAYHPQPAMVKPSCSGEHLISPLYSCCKRPLRGFSTLPHVKDGCEFRDHVFTPSSARNSSTDTANDKESTPNSNNHQRRIYSILCQLRDTICAKTLKTLPTNKKDDENHSALISSQQQTLNELLFLQTEAREPRLPPSSSGEVPISQSSHRGVSKTRSSDTIQHSSSTSHGITAPANNRHSHGQRLAGGAIARQVSHDSQGQSHDLAEMEEDEESERPQVLVQPPQPRRARGRQVHGSSLRMRSSRHDLQVEWIWDSQKSRRWNQDMQRESDERRIASLMSKFSAPEVTTAVSSSTATAGTNSSGTSGRGPTAAAATTTTGGGSSSTGSNKSTSGKTEPVYAGGIFSRLEAQFRAEQAARALALQGTQTRSQVSGRKK